LVRQFGIWIAKICRIHALSFYSPGTKLTKLAIGVDSEAAREKIEIDQIPGKEHLYLSNMRTRRGQVQLNIPDWQLGCNSTGREAAAVLVDDAVDWLEGIKPDSNFSKLPSVILCKLKKSQKKKRKKRKGPHYTKMNCHSAKQALTSGVLPTAMLIGGVKESVVTVYSQIGTHIKELCSSTVNYKVRILTTVRCVVDILAQTSMLPPCYCRSLQNWIKR
jgi:hypothetical protein